MGRKNPGGSLEISQRLQLVIKKTKYDEKKRTFQPHLSFFDSPLLIYILPLLSSDEEN